MPNRITQLTVALTSALVLAGSVDLAEASCLRIVANRSALTLVVSQEGGPAVTVRPYSSQPFRLDGSVPVAVAGYCGLGLRGELPPGAPVLQRSLAVTAVLDRCYYEIGDGFFERELGPGFFPRKETGPFALNAPRQGDLALGPTGATCP